MDIKELKRKGLQKSLKLKTLCNTHVQNFAILKDKTEKKDAVLFHNSKSKL